MRERLRLRKGPQYAASRRPTPTNCALRRRNSFLTGALLAVLTAAGCRPEAAPPEVVVYVSLDEPYARPVLEAFTRETGIRVRPVYDTEATKSRGLAQRIVQERDRPRADVFWSSEVLQMVGLRRQDALRTYRPPAAAGIPARYRDPDGFWTGFAGRFRVIVYNTRRVTKPPRTLAELSGPAWKGEAAMANPLFGTATTEAAALFQVWGDAPARSYFLALKRNGLRTVDGNSVAAEQVARGDALVGLTDTDDAFIRIDAGEPLGIVFPDQQGRGALLIPNTAALVRGGPHREPGRRFLDFLVRPETELLLAGVPSRQLPLHPGLEAALPAKVRPLLRVKAMEVDYARLREGLDAVDAFLRENFLD